MSEQQMQAIMASAVHVACSHLTDDELAALNLVAQLDIDPHNRVFDYNRVAHLFTERNGTKMHEETKNALAQVVNMRLGEGTNE
jgi:hypothetical protein